MRFVVFFFIPLMFLTTHGIATPTFELAEGQCISNNLQYQIDFRLDDREFSIFSVDDPSPADYSVNIRQTGQGKNTCVLTIEDQHQGQQRYIFSAILNTQSPDEYRAPLLNQQFIKNAASQVLLCGETVVSLSLVESFCDKSFFENYATKIYR